jgi:hypothetical protein
VRQNLRINISGRTLTCQLHVQVCKIKQGS